MNRLTMKLRTTQAHPSGMHNVALFHFSNPYADEDSDRVDLKPLNIDNRPGKNDLLFLLLSEFPPRFDVSIVQCFALSNRRFSFWDSIDESCRENPYKNYET